MRNTRAAGVDMVPSQKVMGKEGKLLWARFTYACFRWRGALQRGYAENPAHHAGRSTSSLAEKSNSSPPRAIVRLQEHPVNKEHSAHSYYHHNMDGRRRDKKGT